MSSVSLKKPPRLIGMCPHAFVLFWFLNCILYHNFLCKLHPRGAAHKFECLGIRDSGGQNESWIILSVSASGYKHRYPSEWLLGFFAFWPLLLVESHTDATIFFFSMQKTEVKTESSDIETETAQQPQPPSVEKVVQETCWWRRDM